MTHQDFLKIRRASLSLMEKTKDQAHGISHCYRVWSNAQKISRLYKKFQLDPKILESACLLHDISYSQYPLSIWQYFYEGKRSEKIASRILDQTSIGLKEKQIILASVALHCHSFPFRQLNPHGSVYDQIVQDADTLDLLYPNRKANRLISFFWQKFSSLIKKYPQLFLNLPNSIQLLNL